jgi:[acyl-carrier-protein] S-malonyltransferase
MSICLMFPGQGTQKPGMLRELGNQIEKVENVFDIAQQVTGRNIKDLCLTATAEELQKTESTQLAVTAMNLSYLALLQNEDINPDVTLGHSLGQFSAFVVAGVLTIDQVFLLVQKRAKLMSKVQRSGMLCSVLGLDFDLVNEICKSVDPTSENLVVALYNTQNQIVIGGDCELVIKAEEVCKAKGALRTVPIRVSNAFHTPLMREMEEQYADFVNEISFSSPKCQLMLNCKGDFATDVEDIKNEIKNQCCHTVLWYEGVKKIIDTANDIVFAETGVGKVLTGMMRSIDNRQSMLMMSNPMQYNKFIKLVKE